MYFKGKKAAKNIESKTKSAAVFLSGWLYHTVEGLGEKPTREELAIHHLRESLKYDKSNGQTWYLLGRYGRF